MAKQGGSAKGAAKGRAKAPISGSWKNLVGRDAGAGEFVSVHATRVEVVMAAAERSGLLSEKGGRIGGRVSPALVRQAKAQTGIKTDTDLIEFALASVALEDRFAESFKAVRGTVDPDLKLGF
jgi:hypothetical protein